jgi:DNA ligase 1
MNKTPPEFTISALQDHPSRLEKEAIILAQAKESNDIFFKGVRMALDPMITFGLKQVPEKTDEGGLGLDWVSFSNVVDCLVSRKLTGNAARDAVKVLMDQSKKSQWNNWYRRILIKDLRCGVSEKTVNKVVEKTWPDYAVPIFSCQLAHDSANHEAKVAGKKLLEVKLDGVRVLTIVYPDGRVDQFSRNGKELLNFDHIKNQFFEISNELDRAYVFDGEIMSSSFQDLMKQVHRKDNVNASDAVLYLFDMIPLENFQTGEWSVSQQERSDMLHNWFNDNEMNLALPNVRILEHESVDLNTAEGRKVYKEINQKAIDGGYEGIMIKDPEAPYECKRSHAWLKLKPFIEVTLEVVNVEEGTGKNQGRLGALVCSGTDDGKTITVNVGSGFTDDNRIEFWNSRDSLAGQLVEVRADAITQNQDGTYSLRFPRFLRFRGFEKGEKI